MALITGTASPDILSGTGDADTILGLEGDDALYGFDGDDSVEGGAGDNFLYGGIGNDTLIGGLNDDVVYGGSGNDLLIGGASEDFLYGGSGTDTASYATALAGLALNLAVPSASTGDAVGDSFLSVERFILTGLADSLFGSGLGDFVQGGGGNDLMFGFGGADALFGDGGDDTLVGDVEGDLLDGGGGFDRVSYLSSGAAIVLDLGTPSFTTGDAVGDIYVSIEGLTMTSLADTVRLEGGTIRQAEGEAGNDTLSGGTSADSLFGGTEEDVLFGGNGQDLLDGGDGNDRMFGGAGGDVFVGGTGEDGVFYTTTVKLDLTTPSKGLGDAKGDTFTGIEGFVFLGIGSTYVGGTQDATVALVGASLDCIAGSGAETFQSTGGSLSVSYANAATKVSFTALGSLLVGQNAASGDSLDRATSLTLTKFNDTVNMISFFGNAPSTILAGNGNDTLHLLMTSFAVLIDGGDGRDTITGNLTSGLVQSGAGNDLVTLAGIGFGDGDLTLSTGSGNDVASLAFFGRNTVDLGSGNDELQVNNPGELFLDADGGTGNDTIFGSIAQGILDGGDGNDVFTMDVQTTVGSLVSLSGGAGDDQITFIVTSTSGFEAIAIVDGGAGNDTLTKTTTVEDNMVTTFVFATGWGDDVVTGFLDGTDLLEFSALGDVVFTDLTVSGDATHTLVAFGTDSIDIMGLDVANFTEADVTFS